MALGLSACGFQLRGEAPTGLKSLHVSSVGGSQVAVEVRRSLSGGRTRVVASPADAEAHLRILDERRDKAIATLTGTGRVYEYLLRLTVAYQLEVPGREEPAIARSELELRRLITYSESAPLAKEAEEQLLYREMHSEAASQILRRISLARSRP